MPETLFASAEDAATRLAATGYLTDPDLATVTYLADSLGKPLLLEGPAGTGKTQLANAVAQATGADIVRLQCYEGIDEARALYEWNYRKQLLRIQSAGRGGDEDSDWDQQRNNIFSEEFLLARPLLTAIQRETPTVLLIDETDKADVEIEGLLLEVLSDFQVTIPELGTITAVRRPFVVLTTNATRELSEALRRRCLYHYIGYPSAERERAIVMTRVPGATEELAESVVTTIRGMRDLNLRKPPSVAETIDWTRSLLALGFPQVDAAALDRTLGVVVKHHNDMERVRVQLHLPKARAK